MNCKQRCSSLVVPAPDRGAQGACNELVGASARLADMGELGQPSELAGVRGEAEAWGMGRPTK